MTLSSPIVMLQLVVVDEAQRRCFSSPIVTFSLPITTLQLVDRDALARRWRRFNSPITTLSLPIVTLQLAIANEA